MLGFVFVLGGSLGSVLRFGFVGGIRSKSRFDRRGIRTRELAPLDRCSNLTRPAPGVDNNCDKAKYNHVANKLVGRLSEPGSRRRQCSGMATCFPSCESVSDLPLHLQHRICMSVNANGRVSRQDTIAHVRLEYVRPVSREDTERSESSTFVQIIKTIIWFVHHRYFKNLLL